MYAVYDEATGELVSIGSEVADPLPAGLTAIELTGEHLGLLDGTRRWNPATRTTDAVPPDVRVDNEQTLIELTEIVTRLGAIDDFLTDPDVQKVLDQPNNTALATADLNRALKAIVRQHRRLQNVVAQLVRTVYGPIHPELFDDITDTVGA